MPATRHGRRADAERRQLVVHTSLISKLNQVHFCTSFLNHKQGLVQQCKLLHTLLASHAMPSNGESVSWTPSASRTRGIAVHRHWDPPSTFGVSPDPLSTFVQVKKNRVRFEQIQQAPFCLKEEHCIQLCPGVRSEHSLMDTRLVGPIKNFQMDPTEGNREGGTGAADLQQCPP